jgi:acylphosphatase
MRRAYLVSGAVQGVGFRYFTHREARRIGLRGWVRNLNDGRVEAVADGTGEQLEEFERALRRGPAGSSVTDVHATDTMDEAAALIRFEVR